ncbi:MAG: PaaI family thioesterase [Candidatus Kapabacteria bacterium]|jgi:acyl-coenzyme A thioesterase 13|nr:PaaI family thioesterase [Candidatus Kapabacteria bacterium]
MPEQSTSTNPVLEHFRQLVGTNFSQHSPSPLGRWLDCTIIAAERGMLEVAMIIRPELLNPAGTFHGGAIAALMDDVIGATIFMLGKKNFFTSVNLVVDYFAVAKKDEKIIAQTAIVKEGSTIINAQCEVWNADKSKLLARGTSNLMKIGTER